MQLDFRDGKIWIAFEPDDAEDLRYGLQQCVKELVGKEVYKRFPLIGQLENLLERGIESTVGLPLFPFEK